MNGSPALSIFMRLLHRTCPVKKKGRPHVGTGPELVAAAVRRAARRVPFPAGGRAATCFHLVLQLEFLFLQGDFFDLFGLGEVSGGRPGCGSVRRGRGVEWRVGGTRRCSPATAASSLRNLSAFPPPLGEGLTRGQSYAQPTIRPCGHQAEASGGMGPRSAFSIQPSAFRLRCRSPSTGLGRPPPVSSNTAGVWRRR